MTKHFRKWASKQLLSNSMLKDAVSDLMENKSVNQLGKFLYKIRLRSSSSGKSGGFRTIVVAVEDRRIIFVHGFAKNEKDNLNKPELDGFKQLAKTYASYSEQQIDVAVDRGALIQVK